MSHFFEGSGVDAHGRDVRAFDSQRLHDRSDRRRRLRSGNEAHAAAPRLLVPAPDDDGCESDLNIAAPLLKQAGFGATFYITLGFLGRPGYMIPRQVREIADAGFDVGCHSMTHAYLDDLDEASLRHEIVDAKTHLQEVLGRPVYNFSCPGGRWSSKVARIAEQAGYRSVASSRIGTNRRDADPFHLARVAVMRDITLAAYQTLCRGENLRQLRLRDFIRVASRRVLGNMLYDRLRHIALEGTSESKNPEA